MNLCEAMAECRPQCSPGIRKCFGRQRQAAGRTGWLEESGRRRGSQCVRPAALVEAGRAVAYGATLAQRLRVLRGEASLLSGPITDRAFPAVAAPRLVLAGKDALPDRLDVPIGPECRAKVSNGTVTFRPQRAHEKVRNFVGRRSRRKAAIASSNARTTRTGSGPFRSRLRQRAGRGRGADVMPSRATSQRVFFGRSVMGPLDALPLRLQPLRLVVLATKRRDEPPELDAYVFRHST